MVAMTMEPSPATGAASDEHLLGLVASARSREAFDELFQRYQPAFFNLALHFTGDREAAAEAVQEAALGIWRSAPAFRSDGNARGWMFRIVVRAGLQQLRGKKRRGKHVESLTARPEIAAATSPRGGLEEAEILSALRAALQDLEPLSRQVVALCYGAGLSQREIGTVLELPQRTVGFKLEEALARLRGQLKNAGFAAAVPLVNPADLEQALCAGSPVPPDLEAQVSSRISEAGNEVPPSVSRRAAVAKTGLTAYWPVAAVLALVVALAAVARSRSDWNADPSSNSVPFVAPSTEPVPPPAGAAALDADKPLFKSWTFESGLPAGWQTVEGEGRHLKFEGRDYLAPPTEKDLRLILPVKLPQRPCLLTLQGIVMRAGTYLAAATLTDGSVVPAHRMWGKFKQVDPKARNFTMQVFFNGRHLLRAHNDEFVEVLELDEPFSGKSILLSLRNWALVRAELRELRLEEVPKQFQDSQRAIALLNVKPERVERETLPKQP